MAKRILLGLSVLMIAAWGIACTQYQANSNANNNSSTAATTTRPGPDNSEITTTVDANGVKTETRTFKNNPRVSKVVVTTREGKRTARVYSPSGESKEINDVGDALEATGDKVADGAGWVAEKGKDVAGATEEGAKTAANKSKDVGEKTVNTTVNTAKKVGEKTVEGAKTVGTKTAQETKKAVKKVIP